MHFTMLISSMHLQMTDCSKFSINSRQLSSMIFVLLSVCIYFCQAAEVNQKNNVSTVEQLPVHTTISSVKKLLSSTYNKIHLDLADDLEQAASEIHEAAKEIEAQSANRKMETAATEQRATVMEPQASNKEEIEDDEEGEGIEHEDGNIPFEWRVQLIHKHFDDSWKNRGAQESGQSGGNQERGWEKYRDDIGHGQLRERYTKKKIDILIEEWWNKEKWNRHYWDDYYSDEDAHDEKRGKNYGKEDHNYHKYEDEDQEHSKYNSHQGAHSRIHGRRRRPKYHNTDDSPHAAASGGPHSVMVYNLSDTTGDHMTHQVGHVSEHTAKNFQPDELLGNKKRKIHRWRSAKRRHPHRYTVSPSKDKPACARKTPYFCQKDPDYPSEIIDELIRANQTAFQELTRSAQALWRPYEYRPEKEGISTTRSTYDCRGNEAEAKPLWAPNDKGFWKVIVNTKDMKQTFVTERCTKRTWACATSLGQRCKQRFDVLPLVALDLLHSSPQLHIDWFTLPSTCQCHEMRNHV